MKVVHYLERASLSHAPAGPALIVCAALAEHGHDVILVTEDPVDIPLSWTNARSRAPRVEVIPPLLGRLRLVSRWSRRHIERCLLSAQCLHLHTTSERSSAAAAAIAHRMGIPIVEGLPESTATTATWRSMMTSRLNRPNSGFLLDPAASATLVSRLEALYWLAQDGGSLAARAFDIAAARRSA
jgi:hypothetical protein